MTLFTDLTLAESTSSTDEILVKQDLVYRRVSLSDVVTGESGLTVSGTATELTQTGAEVQAALDEVESSNIVSTSDTSIELTQTASELQAILNKAEDEDYISVADGGVELTLTGNELQSILGSSIGVSGAGGNLTQTLAQTQDILDNAVTDEGSSLAEDGYVKFGNGLIIQWGKYTTNGDPSSHTFGIAFTNNAFNLVITQIAPTTGEFDNTVEITSKSTFTVHNIATGIDFYWYAIGN